MESLTLDKALELYEILDAHIPEVGNEDVDVLEFIGKIVKSMRKSNEHQNYIDAVMLMSNKVWEDVKVLDASEVLNLFIEGLSTNKILDLKIFCNEIGFNDARS